MAANTDRHPTVPAAQSSLSSISPIIKYLLRVSPAATPKTAPRPKSSLNVPATPAAVPPYVLDVENADRLWQISNQLIQ
jgi:hypothetical protein